MASSIEYLYKILMNNREEENALYLFKIGNFFVCLGDDAKTISNLTGLKITNFTNTLIKAGFPSNALEKYNTIINNMSYKFFIIEPSNGKKYTIDEFKKIEKDKINVKYSKFDDRTKEFIQKVANLDLDSLCLKDAHDIILNLKKEAISILKEEMSEKS